MAYENWGARPGVMLRDAMDRLFEQAFVQPTTAGWSRSTGNGSGNGQAAHATFPMNVYEDGEAFHVWALLPGADPSRINVTATGQSLAIEAEGGDAPPEGWRQVWSEWQPVRWRRELTLPTATDAERAEVSYQHGVLRLRLPKPDAVRPRTIKVNVAGR